jgi:hypothetical protein
MLKNFSVCEPQTRDTIHLENLLPNSIALLLSGFLMDSTIQLDDKLCCCTVKIGNEPTQRVLSPKFETTKSPVPQ